MTEITTNNNISTNTLKNAINDLGSKVVTKLPNGDVNIGTSIIYGNGSGLLSLNGNNITTGTLSSDRIPNLNANKITSGTLSSAIIPNLNANKITAGTLSSDRIPPLGYANPRGSESSGQWFSAAYFRVRGGWYICQYNYLRDESPRINIADRGWGSDIDEGSLVFTRDSDHSTVWIKQNGNNTVDAINMTGQHGLFSLNKDLKNNIGYICCVSSEGYWNEEKKFSYKNKKKYININDTLPMIQLSNKKNQKS